MYDHQRGLPTLRPQQKLRDKPQTWTSIALYNHFMGASMVHWTKIVLRYIKTITFWVKGL